MNIVESLIKTPKKMDSEIYFPGNSGNISHYDGNYIIISCSGSDISNLRKKDLIFLGCTKEDLHLKQGGGGISPSTESKLHIKCYNELGSGVILHSHPKYTIVASNKNEKIRMKTEGSQKLVGNQIEVLPHYEAGSKKLAREVTNKLKNNEVALVRNHGLFVKTNSFERARALTESIERSANQWFLESIVNS